jgi:outer membrane protein assembly factor BamA
LILFFFILVAVRAQQSEPTRASTIEAERDAKAVKLTPELPSKAEQVYRKWMGSKIFSQFMAAPRGWSLFWGGMASGTGFAIGPAYQRHDLRKETVEFDFSAVGSISLAYKIGAQISMNRLLHDRMFFSVGGLRFDYPQLAYYGPGMHSSTTNKTNFRLEANNFNARWGIRPDPRRRVNLGIAFNYITDNVGPGTSDATPSTNTVFTPAQAPGIDRQPFYIAFSPFAEINLLDNVADPHQGNHTIVQYNYFSDRTFDAYSFRRLHLETRQYIPFLNKKRVFAMRGVGKFSYVNQGQQVPFYMQPWLGDADALRGYDFYRFRDNNSLLLQAEYRWELFSAMDMAVFFDAGKVMPKPGQMSFSQFATSSGVGFRFRTREAQAFRVDLGFSRETFRIWFKFGSTFPAQPASFF